MNNLSDSLLPPPIPARTSIYACGIQHNDDALFLFSSPRYPHINEFVDYLHQQDISSFLVTNAQFPEAIANLVPVTQLYVSIDAATKESLRAVDRPLFKDFWQRFLRSLEALRDKGQRTVYRLTLVKAYNMTEVEQYAELVERGQPELIEVKAVTYCGKSDGSDLTMQNVPWHDEVRAFCEALAARIGDGYGLACEHRHSCCVLIAKKKFFVDNKWHTWIDYPKFHALSKRWRDSNGTESFTSMEYIAPTPSVRRSIRPHSARHPLPSCSHASPDVGCEADFGVSDLVRHELWRVGCVLQWAVYNAEEAGFDPIETRFRRTKTGKKEELPYEATESGCG